MEAEFSQLIEMFKLVGPISALTQLLKVYLIDKSSIRWGRANKATVFTVYIASFIVIWWNFRGMPWGALMVATILYSGLSTGFYAQGKGVSRFLKRFELRDFIQSILDLFRRKPIKKKPTKRRKKK